MNPKRNVYTLAIIIIVGYIFVTFPRSLESVTGINSGSVRTMVLINTVHKATEATIEDKEVVLEILNSWNQPNIQGN